MKLTSDAFQGLANKKKRDRLVLDLVTNPHIMKWLDPNNLVPFEEFLAMDTLDQIGVNDIACVIHMFREDHDKARDVARMSITQAKLADTPIYANFASLISRALETDEGYYLVERAYVGCQPEIVLHYEDSLIEEMV